MPFNVDVYLVDSENLHLLFEDVKKYRLKIFHIQYQKYQIQFSSPIYYRRIFHDHLPYVTFKKSLGIFSLVLKYLFCKKHVIALGSMMLWFSLLNQLSFGILIDSKYPHLTYRLYSLVEPFHLDRCTFLYSQEELDEIEKKLYQQMQKEIEYLDLSLDGHVYRLTYTKRISEVIEETHYSPLFSHFDAVVDKIDVSSGQVLVKRGQYVAKNQILVSNEIVRTNEEKVMVPVEGKIYGYVYQTYEASCVGVLDVDTYLFLYDHIYDLIETTIQGDGYVMNENVLQYHEKEGKIVLRMQFTLYQNIAKREFLNE